MPSPRFDRLPVQQRRTIERAALREFATHGFHDASLNRVIQDASISKGSFYYYFDGKEDLYAHVAREELAALLGRLGRTDVPDVADAEAFWDSLTALYAESMAALAEQPELAAMLRGSAAVASTPAGQRVLSELEGAVLPWLTETATTGQRVGAIRDDIPISLVIAVATGMGQAMDLWLLDSQPAPEELQRLTALLIDMMRRALQP